MLVSRSLIESHALAVVLTVGLGCSSAAKTNDDAAKSGAAADSSANSGASGSGGPLGQAGHAAGTSAGGAGALGSGGRAATGQPGTGGTSSSGAGGARSTDPGTASDCVMREERIADGVTVPAEDGCNSCTCRSGQLLCTTHACKPDSCLVARHLDTCCATYEPVLRSALTLDECLVAYPGSLDQDLTQRCRAKIAPCMVDCDLQIAPSRVAIGDGMGGCRYSDECQKDQDCVLASNSSACCGCLESMPASLLASDECLLLEGDVLNQPASCPGCTLPVLCGMCQAPPTSATCLIRDSFSICQ